MARIVLGIGTSHSPMLNAPPEMWRSMGEDDKTSNALVEPMTGEPIAYEALLAARGGRAYSLNEAAFKRQWDRCQAAIEQLSAAIRVAAPDVLVIVSADQREMLFDENMPALLIYWGASIPMLVRTLPKDASPAARAANWGYGDKDLTLPVESDLGAHLIDHMVADGFDVSHARYVRQDNTYGGEIGPSGFVHAKYVVPPKRQGVGHGWSFVIRRLLDNTPIPIVPIHQNATFPPNRPTSRRCAAIGDSLRAAIESWDSDKRVCVIASGGLSHFVTNEEIDRRLLDAILSKDDAALASLPDEQLNSAAGEIRNWVTVAAICKSMQAHLIDYVPVYRSEAGTGGGWAFMRWT